MPELAAIGLVGAIVTFLVVNWNLYLVHRSFQKATYLTLNHNFSKVNRYWSLEQGRMIELAAFESQEEVKRKDYQKSTRSAFLFGTMLIFLSWLGLLIFVIYFLSTTKLAKSRQEIRIFQSVLVENPNLAQNEVQDILNEIESLG